MKLFELKTINNKELIDNVFYVIAPNAVAAIQKLNKDFPDEVEEVISVVASDKKKDLYPNLID